jgi:hypothetical protein
MVTIVVTCQLLAANVQEADFVVDPEMKEVAGSTGVGSQELLLQNQEASIRERMRHEIVFKKIRTVELHIFLKYFYVAFARCFSPLFCVLILKV